MPSAAKIHKQIENQHAEQEWQQQCLEEQETEEIQMLEETEAAEKRAEAEVEAEQWRMEVAKAARRAEWQKRKVEKRKQQEDEEEQWKWPRVEDMENLELDVEEGRSQPKKCWNIRGFRILRPFKLIYNSKLNILNNKLYNIELDI